MATIAEILANNWPGTEWTITGDDYDSLQWFSSGTSKPTEQEIRDLSSATDTVLAERNRKNRQQQALNDAPDYLLHAIEVLIRGLVEIRRVVNDVRSTVVPAAHSGEFTAWDSDVGHQNATLLQKVIDLRNIE